MTLKLVLSRLRDDLQPYRAELVEPLHEARFAVARLGR